MRGPNSGPWDQTLSQEKKGWPLNQLHHPGIPHLNVSIPCQHKEPNIETTNLERIYITCDLKLEDIWQSFTFLYIYKKKM